MDDVKRYFKPGIIFIILFLTVVIKPTSGDETKTLSPEERIVLGGELFESKRCSDCHTTVDGEKKDGPDLRKWKDLSSPTLWAAIMWNHVPEMVKTFKEEGIVYPEFQGEDLTYIFEYIHSFSDVKESYTFSGDKDRGAYLFSFLGCKQCHVIKGKSGKRGPNLKETANSIDTDSEFANQMLSHVPYMCKKAEKQKIYWPMLQGNEVAHLFEYFKYISAKN